MKDYERGYQAVHALVGWYKPRAGDRNEATTRLHLIDSLFFECLGWHKDDVLAEESRDRQFADYTFLAPRRMLIAEAKKEGDYFELPAGVTKLEAAIPTLLRTYPNVKSAMEQAAEYCQKRGVPFGCVINGHQLVAFVATRNDGVAPLEGRALVFSSLEQMEQEFLELWNALSKPALQQARLLSRLIPGSPQLPQKLSATISPCNRSAPLSFE
jgi:predicted type IV restriction endonuclease